MKRNCLMLAQTSTPTLPSQAGTKSIAAHAKASRCAYLEFLTGSGGRWTKRELIRFLEGPYRNVTFKVPDLESWWNYSESAADSDVDHGHLESTDDELEQLFQVTRKALLETLDYIVTPQGGESFESTALNAGWVIECKDAQGYSAWLAMDRKHMKLAERILALIAADFLMNRSDFEKLAICFKCQGVSFDLSCRSERICRSCRPRKESGFFSALASEESVALFEARRHIA